VAKKGVTVWVLAWPCFYIKKNKKIGAVKKGGGTAATAENKHPTEFCYF